MIRPARIQPFAPERRPRCPRSARAPRCRSGPSRSKDRQSAPTPVRLPRKRRTIPIRTASSKRPGSAMPVTAGRAAGAGELERRGALILREEARPADRLEAVGHEEDRGGDEDEEDVCVVQRPAVGDEVAGGERDDDGDREYRAAVECEGGSSAIVRVRAVAPQSVYRRCQAVHSPPLGQCGHSPERGSPSLRVRPSEHQA